MPGSPARFPRVAIVGRPGTPDLAAPLARLAGFLSSHGHAVVLEADTARHTPLPGHATAEADALGSRCATRRSPCASSRGRTGVLQPR